MNIYVERGSSCLIPLDGLKNWLGTIDDNPHRGCGDTIHDKF